MWEIIKALIRPYFFQIKPNIRATKNAEKNNFELGLFFNVSFEGCCLAATANAQSDKRMTPEIPVENQKANTKAMEKEEHGKHNVFFTNSQISKNNIKIKVKIRSKLKRTN